MSSAVKQQKLNFIEQNMYDTSFYDGMMAISNIEFCIFIDIFVATLNFWYCFSSHLQLSSHSRIQNLESDYCIAGLEVISQFPSLQSHSHPLICEYYVHFNACTFRFVPLKRLAQVHPCCERELFNHNKCNLLCINISQLSFHFIVLSSNDPETVVPIKFASSIGQGWASERGEQPLWNVVTMRWEHLDKTGNLP